MDPNKVTLTFIVGLEKKKRDFWWMLKLTCIA